MFLARGWLKGGGVSLTVLNVVAGPTDPATITLGVSAARVTADETLVVAVRSSDLSGNPTGSASEASAHQLVVQVDYQTLYATILGHKKRVRRSFKYVIR